MAVIINVPFLVNAFFKLIMPFVDPHTREKVKFNVDPVKEAIFTPENIMKEHWGGSSDFEYEHAKYWKSLVDITDKYQETWLKNWRNLGGIIGLKEYDYKTASGVKTSSPAVAIPVEEPEKATVPQQEAAPPVADVAA